MPADTLSREIFGNIGQESKLAFYALAVFALLIGARGLARMIGRWNRGQPSTTKNCWKGLPRRLFAFAFHRHSTWFSLRDTRPAASWAHRLLFWGFCLLSLGTILIAIEHVAALVLGRAATDPVFHKGLYFAVYELVLDAAGLALLAGGAWFLVRRLSDRSSIAREPADLVVLTGLLFLGVTGYVVEGLRIIEAQTAQPWFSFVGAAVASGLEGAGVTPTIAATAHRVSWWLHAVVALGLLAAVPYTRLRHVVAGSVLLATTDSQQLGTMTPVSIEEVEASGKFGIGEVTDLPRQQLIQLDACVSCGRCEDECPAHAAGKPLSPRSVVQALSGHLQDLVASPAREDTPPLHGEVISEDTLWACTTCSACVEVCPLGVDPLTLITGMRRHLVGSGNIRGPAATALQKLSRSGNPWGLPAEQRFDWAEGLQVPTVEDTPDFEILYWVGCAAAYDRQARRTARAMVRLLQTAKVNFAVLGNQERCTGESARRMGEEFVFAELAATNVETFKRHGVTRILTHCPHCLNSLRHDYPQAGGQFDVIHYSQYLAELISAGRLTFPGSQTDSHTGSVTFHDPCYLARVNGIVDSPRELLSHAGARLTEMPRHGCRTACCGGGGGRMWLDDAPDERVGQDRVDEVLQTATETVVVSCPFCRTMIGDGIAARGAETLVKDLAEVMVAALDETD